ncbi:outer membrane protein assembly factor BamB family protein [Gimesia fumaroli]|uniref:Outer membrane protein assembly factor BamB n=1 Tax=Gimesia fumaroli TaxID=2527976 RepID=A0A518I9E8_9PLAN|nr:PQQ-binding-like beta-propeller repeat protein [Gimesia fumaroli]QDV49733.1 Outer membrane protein assembly factor BamB precursor [Gimesia fumaroli]
MKKVRLRSVLFQILMSLVVYCSIARADEDWLQLKGNGQRSGNVASISLQPPLSLAAAIPLTDGIYTSPVISDGKIFVVDGSGVIFAIDGKTNQVLWKFATKGGAGNCSNVASPAIIDQYLHVGTTAGYYYVLSLKDGSVVKEIDCREPIFSAPAVNNNRVYFATLGAQVYAVEPNGEVAWTWDFVKEVVEFDGNRWSGADWLAHRKDRVTWRDHFVCSRDICLAGNNIVIPAGGRTVFLEDAGKEPRLSAVGEIPKYAGSEYPATFGQSADDAGNVYVQWHRRDNAGRVEVMRLEGDQIKADYVKGTQTSIRDPGLLSFASVSIRGNDVYRVRPEAGLGLCRHAMGEEKTEVLCEAASVCPPIITRDHAIYGSLDGKLYVVPLTGGKPTTFKTAFDAAITAPVAIANGKIYVPCEDGYLYVLNADGTVPKPAVALPERDLEIWKIRSPLTGPLADAKYDWYTNYGDFGGTNANAQGLKPPLRMRWARRLEGTVKHLPVCGGGRLYTHTAEGQIIAVEQDTGRLLWRRYWPDVYLSFTSPLYINGKLLIPQAGIKKSRMRCLDAATGKLLWEAPFTGSPSWSRQFPPVVHGNIAIYASGSGEYAAQGTEKAFTFGGKPAVKPDGREVMSWIYSNDNPYYPKDHRPRIWAWDLDTGKVVWEKDFSEYGRGGNDCGIAILDGKLYYSTFFGYASSQRRRRGLPVENNGITACLDPKTGKVVWLTNKYYVTSKCTLSARDGRIYIGGYNRANENTQDRFVWCLDAKDGSLVWQSDAVTSALNVVTVGKDFIFSNALRGKGNVFDHQTGKVVSSIGHNYACCRFTLSEPYVLGANMDMIDLSDNGKLVSTGPAIDSRECLGAVVSNGRIFYTSQASGFVVSQTFGEDSKKLPAIWERP